MKDVLVDVMPTMPLASVIGPRRIDARTEANRLVADIERAIRVRTGRTIHHLKVSYSQQAVVLSGRCSTFYSKQLAQHAAMTLLQDEQLINDIEVAQPRAPR